MNSFLGVWHDSFIWVTWLIYWRDMAYSCLWHDFFICITSRISLCAMTHWPQWLIDLYVPWLIDLHTTDSPPYGGVAVCCSVLQCVAVCCSVLQCVAVCCSVFVLGLWLTSIQLSYLPATDSLPYNWLTSISSARRRRRRSLPSRVSLPPCVAVSCNLL